MAFRGQVKTFPPLSRGIYDGLNAADLEDPRYTPDSRNSRTMRRCTRKRKGMTQVGGVVAASTRINGGAQFRSSKSALWDISQWGAGLWASATAPYLSDAVVAGAKFYGLSGSTWTDLTGSVVLASGADIRVYFTSFNDFLIGTDGVNTPFKWNGSTTDNATVLGGSPPTAARYITTFANRVVALNCTVGSDVFADGFTYSDINNQDSWTGDVIRIQQAGGKAITGGGFLPGRMIVAFEDNLFQVTDSGNDLIPFEISPFLPGVGCKGNQMVTFGDDLYLVNARGPFSVGASGTRRLLNEPIEEFWSTVDYNDAEFFSGGYCVQGRTIMFGVRTGTSAENDATLVYNPDLDAWDIDTGYVADVMWPAFNALGQRTMYCAGTDRVFELDRGDTDLNPTTGAAVAIDWYTTSPWLDMDDPTSRKIWFEQQVNLLESSDNLTDAQYRLSDRPGLWTSVDALDNPLWDSAKFDVDRWGSAGSGCTDARVRLEGSSKRIQFKWSNSASQASLGKYSVSYK